MLRKWSKSIVGFDRRSNNNNNDNNNINNSNNPIPVGTEATALANLEKNKKIFKYPKPDGFVTKIEYSLLYSMISAPDVYPEEVVLEHVAQEDFSVYLEALPYKQQRQQDDATMTKEERISYAQLSALLALAVQNFPPRQEKNGNNEQKNESNQSLNKQISVSQTLCKAVLQCVLRYAENNDLDRKAEMDELMEPVEVYSKNCNEKETMKQVLPFYLGYAATIVTANPLPLVAGGLIMTSMDAKRIDDRSENIRVIESEKERRADKEMTSLLDEADDV